MFKSKKTLKDSKSIVLENSLQYFFYEELEHLNEKNMKPLSREMIYYSSLVLDKYGNSTQYFENENGKVREKTLGLKLLETKNLSIKRKRREIQDIAETSLMLCGYFSDSINHRLNQLSYYEKIGKSAYLQLNHLSPSFYDQDNFYKFIGESFSVITEFISVLSRKYFKQSLREVILFDMNVNRKAV